MGDLTPKDARNLKPYSKISKPRCPFYGFNIILNGNFMADTEGNQCALIGNAYAPCQMEIRGERPDWDKCPANEEGRRMKLEKVADKIEVLPREFGQGVRLREWMDYILSK